MRVEKRYLGNSGLEVSVLGFGAMTFGEGVAANAVTGHMATADAARLFDVCVDAGVTLFDTADVYAAGSSEEILGQVARAKRHRVLIATKAFGRMGRSDHDMGLSRRHLIDACDASLRRLGTDWIDLYQVHNFDSRTPVEETLRTLDDLVRSGKVRYIGCSNFAAWQLMKALGASDRQGLERYVGQQIQYSLMVRDAELEMLPAGVDQGVGALIWSPLAQGFLSGKFRRNDVQGETRLGSGGTLWPTSWAVEDQGLKRTSRRKVRNNPSQHKLALQIGVRAFFWLKSVSNLMKQGGRGKRVIKVTLAEICAFQRQY